MHIIVENEVLKFKLCYDKFYTQICIFSTTNILACGHICYSTPGVNTQIE